MTRGTNVKSFSTLKEKRSKIDKNIVKISFWGHPLGFFWATAPKLVEYLIFWAHWHENWVSERIFWLTYHSYSLTPGLKDPNSAKFCQILSNSPKFHHFLPNSTKFCHILPNSVQLLDARPICQPHRQNPSLNTKI